MAVSDFILVETRESLREWFGLIDEGVEAIEARRNKRIAIGADVFTAVVNKDVDLYLIRVDEEVVGFLTSCVNVGILGSHRLFIWMLYLRPGTPDIGGEVDAEVDLIAAENGCSGVDFTTARPAWQRRLAKYGYVPETITFSKELSYG
jgi:hypothetical protein